jgi:hypothetical protein
MSVLDLLLACFDFGSSWDVMRSEGQDLQKEDEKMPLEEKNQESTSEYQSL